MTQIMTRTQAVVAASNGVGVDLGFDPALRLTLPVADALGKNQQIQLLLVSVSFRGPVRLTLPVADALGKTSRYFHFQYVQVFNCFSCPYLFVVLSG